MLSILYAVALLGGLGMLFGVLLSYADKKFHVEVDERQLKIREAITGANCGVCGYPGCDAFAEAVFEGKAPIDGCIPGGQKALNAIAAIMGETAEQREPMIARVLCQGSAGMAKTRYVYTGIPSCRLAASMAGGPLKCNVACIGLGDCVQACQFDAIHIVNGLAVIDDDKCTACGTCVTACPHDVIRVLPKAADVIIRCRNVDRAREARDACSVACIGCKRCEKACQHGAIHVDNMHAAIDPATCTLCGDCVAACPTGSITMTPSGCLSA